MTLTEFLLARITEDEAAARSHLAEASRQGWDMYPQRVLVECEVRRRMLRYFTGQNGDVDDFTKMTDYAVPRLLALPYADHPDYNPEWKP